MDSLLESAAAEIARLETRVAVLEAEAARATEAEEREKVLTDALGRLQREVATLQQQMPSSEPETAPGTVLV